MPELTEPTLLPCPFCAGTDLALPDEEHRYYVRCLNLECLADGPYCDSSEEAITLWNTRTKPKEETPRPSPPSVHPGDRLCMLCGKPIADHPKDMTCPP